MGKRNSQFILYPSEKTSSQRISHLNTQSFHLMKASHKERRSVSPGSPKSRMRGSFYVGDPGRMPSPQHGAFTRHLRVNSF